MGRERSSINRRNDVAGFQKAPLSPRTSKALFGLLILKTFKDIAETSEIIIIYLLFPNPCLAALDGFLFIHLYSLHIQLAIIIQPRITDYKHK